MQEKRGLFLGKLTEYPVLRYCEEASFKASALKSRSHIITIHQNPVSEEEKSHMDVFSYI